MDYPKRHWGLRGKPKSGKSTFLATNAERPLYMVDADGRFDFVQRLAPGEVLRPLTKKGNLLPLDIQEQADATILLGDKEVESIGVDSVTQIFSYQSRVASLKGNLSAAEREKRNLSSNKAADMVNKSNAMAILRTLAGFGTSIYYIWHLTDGRDHQGQKETRNTISKEEMERLYATMAVIVDFTDQGNSYFATVTWARDLDGRPANTGFAIQDKPGNFWRGGALRLERCMYTTFENESEAINWGMEKLGNGDYGEVEAHWQNITRKYRDWPVKVAMFVDDVYDRVDKKSAQTPSKQTAPTNGKPKAQAVELTELEKQWADVAYKAPVKVQGKNGVVDGEFLRIENDKVQVGLEIGGEKKAWNMSPEKVWIDQPEMAPPDEDWDQLMAEAQTEDDNAT